MAEQRDDPGGINGSGTDGPERLLRYPFSFRGDALAPELRRLVADRPVASVVTNAGHPAWLVTGHTLVRDALKDPRLSRSRAADPRMPQEERFPPPLTVVGTLAMLRGAGLRDEVVAALGPRQTAVSPSRVREISDTLLDALVRNGEPGDLVSGFALPWAAWTTCELLGLPSDDVEELSRWYGLLATGARAEERLEAEWGAALEHIGRRTARARPDSLIGRMVALNSTSAQPLTHEQLIEIVLVLYVSGFGNPASFLATCALVLADDSDLADRLRRSPELMPAAVEELYRWAVMLGDAITRIATEDVEIGGVRVRAGELILLSIDAAHHDPRVHEAPDVVDIDRKPLPHLRFGQGRHFCPAAALSRSQTRIALHRLLEKLPGLRAAVGREEIVWRHDHAVPLPEALPVRW